MSARLFAITVMVAGGGVGLLSGCDGDLAYVEPGPYYYDGQPNGFFFDSPYYYDWPGYDRSFYFGGDRHFHGGRHDGGKFHGDRGKFHGGSGGHPGGGGKFHGGGGGHSGKR